MVIFKKYCRQSWKKSFNLSKLYGALDGVRPQDSSVKHLMSKSHLRFSRPYSHEITLLITIHLHPNASVVICKRNTTFNSVESYFNDNLLPKYIDETNKFIGLSSMYIGVNGSYMTCRFTRDNRNFQHALVKESKNIVSFPIQPSFEDYTTLDNENLRVDFKNCGTITHFTVTAVIGNGVSIDNVWVGMGLNINRKMPGADVVICKRNTTFNSIEHYYNDGLVPKYMNLSNKFESLSSMSISVSENVLTCKFSRDNSNPNPFYKNLNTESLYVISGYGSMNGEEILIHNLIKETKNFVLFPVVPRCQQFTTLDNDGIRIEFINYGEKTDFKVTAKIGNGVDPNNVWLGLGLNHLRIMPNADVVVCKYSATLNSVEHYYNEGLVPKHMNTSNLFVGLSNLFISVIGNDMTCQFTRQNSYPHPHYINMNTEKLYVISGYGSLNGTEILMHNLIKETKNKVDLTSNVQIKPDYELSTLKNDEIVIYFKNCGTVTHFEASAIIENNIDINNFWFGIGLNTNRKMPNANVVVCKRGSNLTTIEHYFNDGLVPKYLNPLNKYEGISSTSITVLNRTINCKFTRDNSNSGPKYLNLNSQKLYLIAGYGPLAGEELLMHQVVKETKNIVEFPINAKCDQFLTLNNEKMIIDYKNYGNNTEFIVSLTIENAIDITSSYLTFELSQFKNESINTKILCINSPENKSMELASNLNSANYIISNNSIGNFSLLKDNSLLDWYILTENKNILTCGFTINNKNLTPNNLSNEKFNVRLGYGGFNSSNVLVNAVEVQTQNPIIFPVVSDDLWKSLIIGDFSLFWVERAVDVVFVFSTKVSSTNNLWTSFAFSYDKIMGDDSVIICQISTYKKSVETYFNHGRYRPNLLDPLEPTFGLSNIKIEINNGELTCAFSRKKYSTEIENYFDSRIDPYILFAKGSTDDNGLINYHAGNRIARQDPIDLRFGSKLTSELPFSSTSTQTTTKIIPNLNECLIGDYGLFWKDEGNYTNFILNFNMSANQLKQPFFITVSLSIDNSIGNDDVIVWKFFNDSFTIQRYFSQENISNLFLLDSNKQSNGLTDYQCVLNSTLNCTFKRLKFNSSIQNYFNLEYGNKYFVLFYSGIIENTTSPILFNVSQIVTSTIAYEFSNSPIFLLNTTITTQTPTTSIQDKTTSTTKPFINNKVNQFKISEYSLEWIDDGEYTNFTFTTILPENSNNFYSSIAFSKDVLMSDDDVIAYVIQPHTPDNTESSSTLVDFQIGYALTEASKTTTEQTTNLQTKILTTDVTTVVSQLSGQFSIGEYTLTWTDGLNYTDFTFKTTLPTSSLTNFYSSFGFSKDKTMGDDDVISCKINGNTRTLERLYNQGYSQPGLLVSNKISYGLSNINIDLTNNILTCSFRRAKADSTIVNYFNLNSGNMYYLIFARGSVDLTDSPFRILFNIVHRTTGLSALILATTAIYLGVCIEKINLGKIGWGLMIGWTIWIVILPVILEILQLVFSSEKNGGGSTALETIKIILFFGHLIVALGFSIALIVVVCIAEPGKFN
ncbi:unnamed protein product [Brachionus calyciflorus]|uniref:DOMON domain-containing protein n=1 Tax=Brachionus calyciflorus TaxID=104777 RepID=A0A814A1E6_9BILA|nr:unnamed protein product [Brachionus calyciflorus]